MENEKIKNNLNEEEKDKDKSDTDVKKDDVEAKLKETEDKLLRSLAEIENQRRRFENEIKEAFTFGGFNFAKESLPILDNLHRAKISISNDETLKDNKDLDKFIKNIDVIEKDLITIFEKNNIKKIKCIKDNFNPNLHQAMLEIEDDDVDPGTILQEIQAGYMFGERLLRPSFVGVSKKKTHKEEEKNNKKDD